ncbi:hypothetical protein CR513_40659, partial [Mucuna pruriens]
MGEKELIINTPLPKEYVKRDEEALEASFQALEIVGTTSAESERGNLMPSKATIMMVKVLISHGYQPNIGLGKGLEGIAESVRPMKGALTNWTTEALPELVSQKIINTETFTQIGNATLKLNNAGKSYRQDEEEGLEEEALVELERMLKQERTKLQSRAEELEIINLDEEGKTGEIKVGKICPKT